MIQESPGFETGPFYAGLSWYPLRFAFGSGWMVPDLAWFPRSTTFARRAEKVDLLRYSTA